MIKHTYKGKARDVYEIDDNRLIIVASDRISIHRPLPYTIDKKGEVLNKMSEFWFNRYKEIIPNHMITTDNREMPKFFQSKEYNGCCMMVEKVNMFRFECIVRGYITGTCWELYSAGQDICGIKLEEGLVKSQKLKEPIFTPTTKDDGGEDTNVTYEEFEKIVGVENAKIIKEVSIQIYNDAHEFLFKKGIILADTKMEFGVNANNNIILADELLTPDCSRFWSLENYKLGSDQISYDREELKTYIEKNGFSDDVINNIPKDILNKIKNKYVDIYKVIIDGDIK